MNKIVLKVRVSVKKRLSKGLRGCRDAATRLRYLMIVNVINGRSTRETAKVLKVHHTTDAECFFSSVVGIDVAALQILDPCQPRQMAHES